MATATLCEQTRLDEETLQDPKVRKIRGYLENYFRDYISSQDTEKRYIALHKLNTDLFICEDLLAQDSDIMIYEDLRLRFIGTLFDPLYQTDPAVQEAKAEFYDYLEATSHYQCSTGNPACTQAP